MKSGFVLCGLFACLLSLAGEVRAECRDNEIRLRGDWGTAQFRVEIADSPESRATGLMHRESLPQWSGMLFVYESPGPARFWMKNTLIPLDMIFIDESGVVSGLHEEAVPHSTDLIDGGDGIAAVLEVNGGLIDILGMERGTVVQTPYLTQALAAWPCSDQE